MPLPSRISLVNVSNSGLHAPDLATVAFFPLSAASTTPIGAHPQARDWHKQHEEVRSQRLLEKAIPKNL